jgi:hypothetical protein
MTYRHVVIPSGNRSKIASNVVLNRDVDEWPKQRETPCPKAFYFGALRVLRVNDILVFVMRLSNILAVTLPSILAYQ